jgi:hypothetical protein
MSFLIIFCRETGLFEETGAIPLPDGFGGFCLHSLWKW